LSVKHPPNCDTVGTDADACVAPSSLWNNGSVSGESTKDSGEVFASVAGESASDIFPHHPFGAEFISDSALFVEEATSFSTQASTFSSH
jgi:hypothetical protein